MRRIDIQKNYPLMNRELVSNVIGSSNSIIIKEMKTMENETKEEKSITMAVVEFIVGELSKLALSMFENFLIEKIKDETKTLFIKHKIKKFIHAEKEKDYFKSIENEVNFKDLCRYYREDLLHEFKKWLTEIDFDKKNEKQKQIMKRASSRANGNEKAKAGICRFTENLINYLENLCVEGMEEGLLIATSRIICEINLSKKKILKIFIDKSNDIESIIDIKFNEIINSLKKINAHIEIENQIVGHGYTQEDSSKFQLLLDYLYGAFNENEKASNEWFDRFKKLKDFIYFVDDMDEEQRTRMFVWLSRYLYREDKA